MEKKKCIKIQDAECLFRIAYIVHLLLSFNAVINRTCIVNISLCITLGLSAYIGCVKLWRWKKIIYNKNFLLLTLFVISFAVSAAVHYQYGISGNLKGFVWLCMQIWLLYLWFDGEDVRRQIKYIGNVFIAIVTMQNIVNFILFFIGFSYRKVFGYGDIHMLGFHWGRLWGIYDDPNHGAAISVLAIVFALYLLGENVKYKKWYVMSLIFQTLYIYWSDSRTGIYSLVLAIVIWGVVASSYKYKNCFKKKVRGYAFSVGAALLIIALVSPVQNVSGEIRNKTKFVYEKYCLGERGEDLEEEDEDEEVGRKGEMSDPSNRRFAIWKSGVEIWETSPIIGVSWANLEPYAEKELPETYIVDNDLQKFRSLHNMIIDVLVGQGIIGIVLLTCIIVNTLAFTFKNYKMISDTDALLCGMLFTIICISFFISMFISSIFYVNSPETYVFWFAFGGYMNILQKNGETG